MLNLSTVGSVVLKIALVISISQLLLFIFMGQIPHTMSGDFVDITHLALISLLNMLLLVLITYPIIYICIITPFVKSRDEAIMHATYLANYDQLTNLGNRRFIYQNLKQVREQCHRRNIFGAVLLIDLDKFKSINDEYGHDAGDAILIAVAEKLTKEIRGEDIVGRFGGDEFILLINHLDTDEEISKEKVLKIVEKLLSEIRTTINFDDLELSIGASIGVCLFKDNENSNYELIKRADIAMYKAKKSNEDFLIY